MGAIFSLPDRQTGIKNATETLAIAVSVMASLILLVTCLERCRYGIDFTDEGYYLNLIANPWLYKSSATQFGFIYHPLYLLVGGDVVLLRQANILITVVLAFTLSLLVIRRTSPVFAISTSRFHDISLSFILSTSVLVILHNWLPTPSYNWLALQALLITSIGIILISSSANRALASPAIIGLGGWLALMAKPTTAAALSLVVLIYLIITHQCRRRILIPALGSAFVLTLVSALIIDSSLPEFFTRLQNGAQDAALLAGSYTLRGVLRFDLFSLSSSEKPVFWAIVSLMFVAILLGFIEHTIAKTLRLATLVLTSLANVLIWAEFYFPAPGNSPFQGLWAASIPLGVVLSCIVLMRNKLIAFATSKTAALVALFAILPHVFAFGTNRNYWQVGADAAIFWIMAGIVMLRFLYRNRPTNKHTVLIPVVAGAQLVAVTLVQAGMEYPYRQPLPLRFQNNLVVVGENRSSILVAPSTAIYINTLRTTARNSGFIPGMPVIDLTGHYPGTLFALGASPIGLAWIIGGYPGSAALATTALDRVPCEILSQAWVLLEPKGPRHLPDHLLSRYGIILEKGYKTAARISSPDGEFPPQFDQLLLKPTKPPTDSQAACKQFRHTNEKISMKKTSAQPAP